MNLRIHDFGPWMKAVHGHSPFPWQTRLLSQVRETGWTKTLHIPTGAGKTGAIDVALFALALELSEKSGKRRMPLRVVCAGDRRIVADGALARAERIAEALQRRQTPVVAEVAEALLSLGTDRPLHTALVQDGMYREDCWARQPNQPAVVCSTIDQIGSRLFHRGYGTSPTSWPIHAGLLGNDALLLIDEAHCSQAFVQTLGKFEQLREREAATSGLPWAATAMTSAPSESKDAFTIGREDLEHPVLRKRLSASRPLSLRVASGRQDKDFIASMRDAICEKVAIGTTVLAVANRVRTARAIHAAIEKLPASQRPETILLTGRSRGHDREKLLARCGSRLMAGRDRAAYCELPGLVVIATQWVETGADLDADVLVTEACPIDVLRQRLGRVNRLGERDASACVVVARQELAWDGNGEPLVDAIYGTAVAETWSWLTREQALSALDGGTLAFEQRSANHPPALVTPSLPAPILFPAYCELWAQTEPAPASSPEPSVFLHGPERGLPEVQIVWRVDLDRTTPENWKEAVALCAPVPSEALPIPLAVARAWIEGTLKAERDDTADIEGLPSNGLPPKDPAVRRPFLCWRGIDRSECSSDGRTMRPGDTIVVPASYGGCDEFGWMPESTVLVQDIADAARLAARRAPVIRIHSSVVGNDVAIAAEANDEQPDDLEDRIDDVITALMRRGDAIGRIARALLQEPQRRVEPHPSGKGYVAIGRAGVADDGRDLCDEDESASASQQEQTVRVHAGEVSRLAEAFGRSVGLSEELASDLVLAAQLHDIGKHDPRYQAWLRDGDRLSALRGATLATSPRMASNPAALQRTRERAGYPAGGRHELLSVRLAESSNDLLERAHDRELVLHLIGSHHGRCRPFAPVVEDPRPMTVQVNYEGSTLTASSATGLERLDSGVADRFFALMRRYGCWGLSYLEACVRLADRCATGRSDGGTP